MQTVDCIIPFYNERVSHVQEIVRLLLQAPWMKSIICVDDGSTNNSSVKLKKEFKGNNRVQIIRYTENRGKSYAVGVGLEHVQSEAVLTLDADMSDVSLKELRAAKKLFFEKQYELLILRLIDEPKQARNFRGDLVLSGQRFINVHVLRNIYDDLKPRGYGIEMATNIYVLKHNIKYGAFPFTAHNIQPINKLGFIKGIMKETHQLIDMILGFGLPNLVYVYFSFENHLE